MQKSRIQHDCFQEKKRPLWMEHRDLVVKLLSIRISQRAGENTHCWSAHSSRVSDLVGLGGAGNMCVSNNFLGSVYAAGLKIILRKQLI